MGFALARAARSAGHSVHLVAGPSALDVPAGVEVCAVESALQMAQAVEARFAGADVVFGAAAVADERPAQRAAGKPAKPSRSRSIELLPNPDIIAGIAARKGLRVVVGFALEASGEDGWDGILARGRDKLERKQLDAIAVNASSALGAAASEVVLLFADGREERLPRQSKETTAERLIDLGVELWRAKQRGT